MTGTRERHLVLLAIFALGVSAVVTQLALLRELLAAFAGNELVLGIGLGNWLLLTGLGAMLGRLARRWPRPLRFLAWAQILVAVLPLLQVVALRTLRDLVFGRGAQVGVTGTLWASFVVLTPFCLLSGAMLTVGCHVLSACRPLLRSGGNGLNADSQSRPATGDAATIGRVYVADSLGSIAGGALFSFVLVLLFDHCTALCIPAAINLALALVMAWTLRERLLFLVAAAMLGGLGLAMNLDALTTALQHRGQQVVFRGSSPYGRLVVTESAGQLNFSENGVPLFSTHNTEPIEETVHYALAQRPDARRVLLIGGGVTGTAREILKYPAVTAVVYVELDPLILEVARRFVPAALADPRIRVVNTDGRLFLKSVGQASRLSADRTTAVDNRDACPTNNRTAGDNRDGYPTNDGPMGDRQDARSTLFDVMLVDLPEPSTAQLNRFYTAEFFAEAKRALLPDGVLAFALGRYENYVGPEQARLLASAKRTLRESFGHTLLLPGGRIFVLASDGPLTVDIAARLAQAGVPVKLMNRHYLDAMLTPDRLADLRQATMRPAAVNRDFTPMLYLYHLRHWRRQFPATLGALEVVLALVLVVYLVRLRAPALVVFAGGFAASALELVLLLGFQILYGSVYRQLGVIVTAFMAGLAAGAWWMNRRRGRAPAASLIRLALGIALFALLLPVALGMLGRAAFGAAPVVIPVLTFGLAVLVGIEFPVASRADAADAATTAGRLYAADFIGASLGALLASTLLIPLAGVAGTCWLTAGLNVIAAAAGIIRNREEGRRNK